MASPAINLGKYKQSWVEAFHVNIGVGDSTIMVLRGRTILDLGNPVVLKVALIDGGYASYEESGSIVKLSYLLSKSIPNSYSVAGPLQLDSLVITHWDADHYAGIIGLLSADIQAKIVTRHFGLTEGQVATRLQIRGFVPTELDANRVECAYLKYSSTGEPLTVLYVPHTNLHKPTPNHRGFGPPKSLMFNSDGTVDLNIWIARKPLVMKGVCKFISNSDRILGTNVFTHDLPPEVYFADPATLANSHALEYNTGVCPGLFIIASNNKIIAKEEGPPSYVFLFLSLPTSR